MIKPTLCLAACFLLVLTKMVAQQTAEKFVRETRYLLTLPPDYTSDTTKRWPLVLFLHGSGQRGTDLEKVKDHGPPKLASLGKEFPFILVSPQTEYGWVNLDLIRLLGYVKTKYRVDDERVYLTGLSMGGYGTWELATEYPQEFAAIVPICGGGDTAQAWKLRNMPAWVFHGAKDNVVSPKESINMVEALRQYNPSVRFTLYPEADHNSWERAYGTDSLYAWMLAQRKFRYKEQPVNPSVLKRYEGTYASDRKDTVKVMVMEGKLMTFRPGKAVVAVPMKAAGENLFFYRESAVGDMRFTLANGAVTGFDFASHEKIHYRKL